MKTIIGVLLFTVLLGFPVVLCADECMEGDCDNGIGSGFTEDNKIYEGEWKNGLPHGEGKLYVSRGEVIEGVWEKGELVEEKKATEVKENKEP